MSKNNRIQTKANGDFCVWHSLSTINQLVKLYTDHAILGTIERGYNYLLLINSLIAKSCHFLILLLLIR